MASPFNMPQWPGVNEPLSFPAPVPQPDHHENIFDPDLVLARLREQAAEGKQDLDVLLGALAVAAQAITDATGAALGIRRDGTVVCVGRSGDTAPALGARLNEESGISGECLRSCRSQRCDDTQTDARVDAEVCRNLGLRSIAAVPVRSRLETIGILEVFSTEPHAFTDQHLVHLSSLAEIADAATANADVQPVLATPHAGDVIPRPHLPILESPWAQRARRINPIWRYVGLAGAVVLLVLFALGVRGMWHELRSRNEAQPIAVPSAQAAPVNTQSVPPDEAALQTKPTSEQVTPVEASTGNTQPSRVVQAAKIEPEPDDGLIRSIPVEVDTTTKSARPQTPSNNAVAAAPPQVAMVSASDDTLHGILSSQKALPKLSPTVSEGVTPLVLEHKVMPTYPRDARLLRLEGVVVMHATVTDKGRISDLKAVSGNPVLARAALDAVKQWRYRPAELNGKPTDIETDITISFKLP
jgi:TonB family protein